MSNLHAATSSGLKQADAIIYTGPCILLGFELQGDGTNACNAVLYDNTAASGTALSQLFLIASSQRYITANIPPAGIFCNNGIYVDVTGTGVGCIVHFAPA